MWAWLGILGGAAVLWERQIFPGWVLAAALPLIAVWTWYDRRHTRTKD